MRLASLLILALALATLGPAGTASAGCGCDHPPPEWHVVMPPFASPGTHIQVWAEDGEFLVGESYEVEVAGKKVFVVADRASHLELEMPYGVKPGPAKIEVKGSGYEHKYPAELFTALPKAVRIKERNGAFTAKKFKTAVSADGTLFLPVDLSRVLDPMQFAFMCPGLPLDFGHDDVVLYNADGVDLTVFTLAVDDSTERQWGSYYGWEVDQDAGLTGTVYETKVKKAKHKDKDSDVFTYWRHEFASYAAAHEPGGSHEVDADGIHPDGTLHIDHDHLVIAIQGLTRPKDVAARLLKAEQKHEEDLAKADADLADDLEKAKDDEDLHAARRDHRKALAKADRDFEKNRRSILKAAKRLKAGDLDPALRFVSIQSENPLEPDDLMAEAEDLVEEELVVE